MKQARIIRSFVVKATIFLLLGTIVHLAPTLAEVTEIQRHSRWWINDYFTIDYVGQLDGEFGVCCWNWRAGVPLTWIEGQMPGTSRVRWLALAADSAIWGLALWLIWASFMFVRREMRKMRMSRALCPACAYPIGVSPVCTECGEPVQAKGER
jgi:hypothetical protein